MPNINILKIQRLYRHLVQRYVNLNNVVIAAAFLIALSWALGSIGMMERNYRLQQQLDLDKQQLTLAQLEVDNAKYEKNYHQTNEYKELLLRQDMGLANPGEKLLILPPNSQAAINADKQTREVVKPVVPESNFQQWMDFLGGKTNGLK